MVPIPEQKNHLRKQALFLLKRLSQKRRDQAKEALLAFIQTSFASASILSFVSLQTEISTDLVNAFLAKENRLYLPKIHHDSLEAYLVESLTEQLEISSYQTMEPIKARCKKIDPSVIDIILVPALLFDRKNIRLGRGKGHYDRFLQNLVHPKFIGIGFKEQLFDEKLPSNSFDVPLHSIYLF